MEIWWVAGKWRTKIESIQVERHNDKSVWINGSRKARHSEWEHYFPTWKEAHQYLLTRAEAKVLDARRQLQYANDQLGNVKGMKEPQP